MADRCGRRQPPDRRAAADRDTAQVGARSRRRVVVDVRELRLVPAALPHLFGSPARRSTSPRGRIDAMRAVDSGAMPIDDLFVDFMETCVQCRGCEPACPSGVHFGALMEETRTALATNGTITPWWQRLGLPRPGSSSDIAGRLLAARRPSASATRPASSRACRLALATPGTAQVDRHRRLAVHRLRDGCMATQHPPQLRRADHADRRHLRRSRFEGHVLRHCTSTPASTTMQLPLPGG